MQIKVIQASKEEKELFQRLCRLTGEKTIAGALKEVSSRFPQMLETIHSQREKIDDLGSRMIELGREFHRVEVSKERISNLLNPPKK
ncbi:hypothetical protein [Sanyastnella coralliicola]|uniref:hypothetical protein n=1 Tax=Sanyastnella coralliicola TaxID=3069118 RepID=UPI0027B91884|nr:hypothetical protein [Longitalea sp. SCSIO 12813]